MKTINIDGQECIEVEEAIRSVLKDVQADLFDCSRKIGEIREIIETIQKLKEEKTV